MKHQDVKKTQELMRKERIKILGGFGSKKEQIVPDTTKYSRKVKHIKKTT